MLPARGRPRPEEEADGRTPYRDSPTPQIYRPALAVSRASGDRDRSSLIVGQFEYRLNAFDGASTYPVQDELPDRRMVYPTRLIAMMAALYTPSSVSGCFHFCQAATE
jgi:hypothetical protein